MRHTLEVSGQVTEITVDPRTGRISNAADWQLVFRAVDAGLVRLVSGGPATFGHTDGFVVGWIPQ